MVDFFEELPEYDVAMYTHKKMKTNSENSLEVLTELLPILEATDDYQLTDFTIQYLNILERRAARMVRLYGHLELQFQESR